MEFETQRALAAKWDNLQLSYMMAIGALVPVILSFHPICSTAGIIGMGLIYLVYINFIESGSPDTPSTSSASQYGPHRVSWQPYAILWLTCGLAVLALFRHNVTFAIFIEILMCMFWHTMLLARNDRYKSATKDQTSHH